MIKSNWARLSNLSDLLRGITKYQWVIEYNVLLPLYIQQVKYIMSGRYIAIIDIFVGLQREFARDTYVAYSTVKLDSYRFRFRIAV